MHRFLSKAAAILGAAVLAFAVAGCGGESGEEPDSDVIGSYKTVDTQGNPMSITLDEEGSASGERLGKTLIGSWKEEEGNAVMITWADGWRTKIVKDGDTYTKTGYRPGDQDGVTAPAEKVK